MRNIITFCLLLVVTTGMAQSDSPKRWGIGINGGYCNDQTFTSEGFVRYAEIFKGYKVETKAGLNYHTFDSEFQSFDKLSTKSIGLFAEAIIFPFHNSFFTGIRWDFLTLNWLTDDALKQLETIYSRSAFSGIFSGTNFYVLGGIQMPVAKKINLQLCIMPGIRQYKIYQESTKSLQSNHTDFIYQINLGVNFSF